MGDNIFVQDEPNPEKVERAVKERSTIPPEYKKFVLSSNGKLNVPRELHFKDYNFDDALKIGMTDEENIRERAFTKSYQELGTVDHHYENAPDEEAYFRAGWEAAMEAVQEFLSGDG